MRNAGGKAIRRFLLLVIAVIILLFFVTPFSVKGYSMYPTISPGTYVLVNKVPYFAIDPGYGDIILVSRSETDGGSKEKIVQRVIGLAGDTIEVRRGVIYRNGKAVTESYVSREVTPVNIGLMTVPKNSLYVMGDNRGTADIALKLADGIIPAEDILGRVEIKIFPLDRIGAIK